MASFDGADSDSILVTETVSSKSGSFSISNSGSRSNQLLKKYHIERSNLLNISKICIKTLIDTTLSVGTGRTLTEESATLEQFFVVLEHVIRHGLKGINNLFSLLTDDIICQRLLRIFCPLNL